MKIFSTILILLLTISHFSCSVDPKAKSIEDQLKQNDQEIRKVIKKHLDALTDKDLKSLAETMSPSGEMTLIMEGEGIKSSVDSFLDFHEKWFANEAEWSLEATSVLTKPGLQLGFVTVESVYREPERNGKPYYNKLVTTYLLEKEKDGSWAVINDHYCSVEKSQ